MSCPDCRNQPVCAVVMTRGFPDSIQTVHKLRIFDDADAADKTARAWFESELDDMKQSRIQPRLSRICSYTVHFEGRIVDELGGVTTIQVTENIEQ